MENLLATTPTPTSTTDVSAGGGRTFSEPLVPTSQIMIPSAQKITSAPHLHQVDMQSTYPAASSSVQQQPSPSSTGFALDPLHSRATDLMRDLFHKFSTPSNRTNTAVGRSVSNDNALLF